MTPDIIEDLRAELHYDRETGVFTWIKGCRRFPSGSIAGSTNRQGYRRITWRYKTHMAHKIAWAIFYGVWPSSGVDHRNGNTVDNRIENLRLSTIKENSRNRKVPSTNSSGFKGVFWEPDRKKWRARIEVNGRPISLGRYFSAIEAAQAYDKAAEKYFGQFARTNKEIGLYGTTTT